MAGIAHSSPMDSGAMVWKASTNSSTLPRSMRPSVWAIRVMASS